MKISKLVAAAGLTAALLVPVTALAQTDASRNAAEDNDADDGASNLGWLGLLGLAGLFGLKKKAGQTDRTYAGGPASART